MLSNQSATVCKLDQFLFVRRPRFDLVDRIEPTEWLGQSQERPRIFKQCNCWFLSQRRYRHQQKQKRNQSPHFLTPSFRILSLDRFALLSIPLNTLRTEAKFSRSKTE